MELVITLKDGPHRLQPIGFWGIAYSQKLLALHGVTTPAAHMVAVLAALLSEAEPVGPDGFTPMREWGFAEVALLIPAHKHVLLEMQINRLFEEGMRDPDAPDEPEDDEEAVEEDAGAVPFVQPPEGKPSE